ncbi:MAG: RDD family protein [Sulfuritalea sp.]|jgi:uncharacterized RDD family membrane protein YckC|nr:RDD family protein [Sulfuritalea sp.]
MRTPATDSWDETPTVRRRIASMAYESLLLVGVLSISFFLPHLALGMTIEIALPGWVLWAHVFIVLGAYFVWYWRRGGQTLAMQTWRIRLSTPSGAEPSMTQLALRYFLAWPSVICLGSGLFWAFFDRDRQYLHDRLAGTRLVLKRR